ncbi:hypothetical protein RGR602_CH03054 [Rhizobium gallicum bv. gallicum R602sp]|uniref:Uncharacterized protein n=1 Tax=Rhizobium gallicum bv. gallicum R602sp TaxID=1041138 RepID=A0A0B4X5F5_9HYPH|nr:hypothetical protein RGR602_CH03054 [Rhizobium gallicum bv. gallicum R602sp]
MCREALSRLVGERSFVLIDAVVTWVDGDDPAHVAKRAVFQPKGMHSMATASTRFAHRGEIKYCVWSILHFCPFIRRVFVVTDDQKPDALESLLAATPDWESRIEIVSHRAIYGEHDDLLPVFSSRSVETMLYRIPDLAEQFIYLNDDIFIGRSLTADYFFRDGRPVLRGQLRHFPNGSITWLKGLFRRGPKRAGFKEAQQMAARLAGRTDDYLLAGHHPHAMRRSTMAAFLEQDITALRAQAGYRFRSPAQFSPIGIANNLELNDGSFVEAPTDVGFIKPPRNKRASAKIAATMRALVRGELACICVQSLDAMSEQDSRVVSSGLEEWFRLSR